MPQFNAGKNGNTLRDPKASAQASNKQIPHNIEAERSVLAACMLNQDAIDEVAAKLVPENFFRPAHQIIFRSMLDLHARSLPIDQISLAENLRAVGQLEAIGDKSYLVELADNTFALTNWVTHADIVKRTSILRDLIYASAQITALAYDAPDSLAEVVETAEKTLFRVTEQRVSASFTSITDLLTNAFDEITKLAEQKNHMAGVPTGFADVDNLFHGLRPGDLVILAARPGVGKTSFALNLAVNAAKAGYPTTFFSLEMSSLQLVQRILCSEARISLEKVRGGFLGEADWQALADAITNLANTELFIDDTPSLSILEARAKARRELRGKENGLIIVDYLQLMQPAQTRRDGNRAVEVGEISRGLKVLAKEMGMPVIALSQLSRAIEQRGKSKRPMLSDLRESGSIEQDADIVMFIDRSMDELEAESDERPDLGTANLIVAKHRNGATRDITLSWTPENTTFGDYFDDSRYAGAF
ncbi:replicative DNA helicase [Cryptobacterium curtum]|uniref:replicative DNA helicase n=1 Tax=Cryptobacterium curtum TaxID=84163 RepID=UPI0028D1F68E|nr:replicative DNA helicase [Cryptobacterium curtum]